MNPAMIPALLRGGALWLVTTVTLMSSAALADTPLFADDGPMAVTVEGPFRKIGRDRTGEPEWHPGRLMHTDTDGMTHTFDIRVRARGKNRRKSDVCQFPPLRLDFDRSETVGTPFAGQNKLKLVTHCQGSSRFEQLVRREMLAYRLYNLVSDCSFRIRELTLTYIDSDRPSKKPAQRLGFLIEDRDDVARRCGGKRAQVDQIGRNQLDPAVANRYEFFQYMIGNTDWSMLRAADEFCCHNGMLVETGDDNLLPVPYDFDASGLVDAPYAAPSEELGIDRVTQRLYRGFCRGDDVVAATIADFNRQKDSFYALIDAFPGFTKATRIKTTRYLDRFYETINDPKRRKREIDDECR